MVRGLAEELKVEGAELEGPDRGWQISRIRVRVGYMPVRKPGTQLKEVAYDLRRDAATVTSLTSRLAERMEKEERLRREVGKLAKIV
jgi:hypothetical protein